MYTLDDFHLVHGIQNIRGIGLLEIILNDGTLKSLKYLNDNEYGGYWGAGPEHTFPEFNYSKKVFMAAIMPDKKGNPAITKVLQYISNTYLIFDPQLIKDYADCSLQITGGEDISYPHYCETWNYGNVKGCTKYDDTKSLLENLMDWRNSFFKSKRKNAKFTLKPSRYSGGGGELTIMFSKNDKGECVEGRVPLHKYLQAIYVPIAKRNKEQRMIVEQLKNLSKKYPQYNWIFAK